MGRHDAALALVNGLLEKECEVAEVFQEQGLLYLVKGGQTLAEPAFVQQYLLDPADMSSWIHKGFHLLNQSRQNAASGETAKELLENALAVLNDKGGQIDARTARYTPQWGSYNNYAFMDMLSINQNRGLAYLGLSRYFAMHRDREKAITSLLTGYFWYYQVTASPPSLKGYHLPTQHSLGKNYTRIFWPDSPFTKERLRQYPEFGFLLSHPALDILPLHAE
jgi:hypothetical protein